MPVEFSLRRQSECAACTLERPVSCGGRSSRAGRALLDDLRRLGRRYPPNYRPRHGWDAEGKATATQLIKSFIAMIDQLEISNQHAFFGKVLGTGRHGAGRNSSNFCVMCAIGGEEKQFITSAAQWRSEMRRRIYRRDYRDVGQMRAATIRIVRDKHIAGTHVGIIGHDSPDRFCPWPQGEPECAAH